jgi:hypothetical protein
MPDPKTSDFGLVAPPDARALGRPGWVARFK